jgi:hypothetical protein
MRGDEGSIGCRGGAGLKDAAKYRRFGPGAGTPILAGRLCWGILKPDPAWDAEALPRFQRSSRTKITRTKITTSAAAAL